MKRKLYALFILAWAIGALVLVYLYFYVYYTGTLTINANVEEYRVELYSPGTTQKWSYDCPDFVCEIYDVSPFDYNVSIIKPEYETKIISYKVRPRWNEALVIQLEKQVRLESVSSENLQENPQEKIQRLRDENLYYAVYRVDDNQTLRFSEDDGELVLQYIKAGQLRDIGTFKMYQKNEINISAIYESENILIQLWNENYIFDTNFFRIQKLPEIKNLRYVKYNSQSGNYVCITSVWAFVYDQQSNSFEFQYQFKDYVAMPWFIIGVIHKDEDQKRKNFNITEKWNVIVKYSQADKTRKVIYSSANPIDEIFSRWDNIFIKSWWNTLELKNFD